VRSSPSPFACDLRLIHPLVAILISLLQMMWPILTRERKYKFGVQMTRTERKNDTNPRDIIQSCLCCNQENTRRARESRIEHPSRKTAEAARDLRCHHQTPQADHPQHRAATACTYTWNLCIRSRKRPSRRTNPPREERKVIHRSPVYLNYGWEDMVNIPIGNRNDQE